jgi:hypothetical protein
MSINKSIKVVGLGLAALFSSATFANDAIVFPGEAAIVEYPVVLTEAPTIEGNIFYGKSINCVGDEYSANVVFGAKGPTLEILTTTIGCRSFFETEFQVNLDTYINHPFSDSGKFYNALPLANEVAPL